MASWGRCSMGQRAGNAPSDIYYLCAIKGYAP
jgi:hypothetical protein